MLTPTAGSPTEPQAAYRLTYAPALRANGVPIASNLSRHERNERKVETVEAPSPEAAIALFERTTDRMVTAWERAQ